MPVPTTVHAIGFHDGLPIDDPDSMVDLVVPVPEPRPLDLIVRPEAVSVNPVDIKVRQSARHDRAGRVIGYDASGTVMAVGSDVSLFAVGDEVFYAGAIDRPGTNADLHAVDERIVGRKPTRLSHAEASALPLTAITAWEALFDHLKLGPASVGTLLVVGGAGGVPSILIQLARQLTGMTVIATASRLESTRWVKEMGAHHTINHHQDLTEQLRPLAPDGVDAVFTSHTDAALIATLAEVVRPFGQIVGIDDPDGLNVMPLKTRSLTWHWESMFARSLFGTPDMVEQHRLLQAVSRMLDEGTLRTTLTRTLTGLTAANLREAHRLVEMGDSIGKVIISRS